MYYAGLLFCSVYPFIYSEFQTIITP